MTAIMCLVQEGRIEPSTATALKDGLGAIAAKAFGGGPQINWIEVQKGNGFTEAKPSTSSLVSMPSSRPLPQQERIAIMKAICDLWMDKTGCSINEIVAAVSDPVS